MLATRSGDARTHLRWCLVYLFIPFRPSHPSLFMLSPAYSTWHTHTPPPFPFPNRTHIRVRFHSFVSPCTHPTHPPIPSVPSSHPSLRSCELPHPSLFHHFAAPYAPADPATATSRSVIQPFCDLVVWSFRRQDQNPAPRAFVGVSRAEFCVGEFALGCGHSASCVVG